MVMRPRAALVGILLFGIGSSVHAIAPHNVLLIVNRAKTDDLEIANHYRKIRGIPDRNVCYLDYTDDPDKLSFARFETLIYRPCLDYLRSSGLSGTVSCWVTTPSFPYVVEENSLSSVIFFGQAQKAGERPELGPGGFVQPNPYENQMLAWQPSVPPARPSFLHMSLDAGSLADTLAMIDRSARADGSRPDGVVYLLDGAPPRDTRKVSIAQTQRMLQLLGVPVEHGPGGAIVDKRRVMGVYVGCIAFPVKKNTFLPGALGDHLTSLGGALRTNQGQMLAREFLAGGCSATYGAVIEPYNYPQKFPSAKLYVYYALGFSAVESYWMSVYWPQHGLFQGDPLTRPFAEIPTVAFQSPPTGEVRGQLELKGQARIEREGPFPGIARLELFADGRKISDFTSVKIPEKEKVIIGIGSTRVGYDTTGQETLATLTAALREPLLEAGYESRTMPGEMVILAPPGKGKSLRLTGGSTTPLVSDYFCFPSFLPGKNRSISVIWYLLGQAQEGDTIEVELLEAGEVKQKEEYRVPRPSNAASVGNQLAAELTAKLPRGYVMTAQSAENQTHTCSLTLVADSGKIATRPGAMLRLRKAAASALQLSEDGKTRPLGDDTLQAYDAAWFRLGVGEREVEVKAVIPTEKLTDGRHVFRLVAHQGTPAEPSHFAETVVVVRNHPGRLTLEPVKTTLQLGQGPVRSVAAKLNGLDGAAVEFRINGHAVSVRDQAPFDLMFEPAKWGVGEHTVTARARLPNRTVQSDQAVVVKVER